MHSNQQLINILLANLSNQQISATPLTEIEWHQWLHFAHKHGVAPLLYHRLNSGVLQLQIPEPIRVLLCQAYYQNVLKNKHYYHELSKVLKPLHAAGIKVIVLKGAFLAKTVYPIEALRMMSDIDLLIQKQDLEQTEKIMVEMGYGSKERLSIDAQCAMSHELHSLKKNGLSIDIHWTISKITEPLKITVDEELWQRSQEFMISDFQVFSLSPEDLIVHLCFNTAYQNGFVGIRFLCDIDYTLKHYPNMDWEYVYHRAKHWNIEKPIYLALSIVTKFLGTHIPEHVLQQLKPNDFKVTMLNNIEQIFMVDIDFYAISPDLAHLWLSKTPFQKKLSFMLQKVFLPPNTLAHLYGIPPKKSLRLYFYYLVRWKDLLYRYGGKILQILRSDVPVVKTQYDHIATLKHWMETKN
ncbi:MAG: nucleotidyltransferase family protein [Thiomargarita sp.]|nr:nucleotidyltransferase family protein [Thiomargarita sp.]